MPGGVVSVYILARVHQLLESFTKAAEPGIPYFDGGIVGNQLALFLPHKCNFAVVDTHLLHVCSCEHPQHVCPDQLGWFNSRPQNHNIHYVEGTAAFSCLYSLPHQVVRQPRHRLL